MANKPSISPKEAFEGQVKNTSFELEVPKHPAIRADLPPNMNLAWLMIGEDHGFPGYMSKASLAIQDTRKLDHTSIRIKQEAGKSDRLPDDLVACRIFLGENDAEGFLIYFPDHHYDDLQAFFD